MAREVVEQRRLSRAAIETLAIIAYHQPVTRAEIEEIRGVSASRGTVDQLIELGWVRFGRRRMTVGRPVTFVVTQGFLDHFGLENARDLPGLKELREAGLLDSRPADAEAAELPRTTPGSSSRTPRSGRTARTDYRHILAYPGAFDRKRTGRAGPMDRIANMIIRRLGERVVGKGIDKGRSTSRHGAAPTDRPPTSRPSSASRCRRTSRNARQAMRVARRLGRF
jgi:hypothetical protein